jgi:hypothetical protein
MTPKPKAKRPSRPFLMISAPPEFKALVKQAADADDRPMSVWARRVLERAAKGAVVIPASVVSTEPIDPASRRTVVAAANGRLHLGSAYEVSRFVSRCPGAPWAYEDELVAALHAAAKEALKPQN